MAKWTFEPGHTAAEFRARHMMVTYVRGHFKNIHGTLEFDPARPRNSSLEVRIDASEIWTGVKERDNRLRYADGCHVPLLPSRFHWRQSVLRGKNCAVLPDQTQACRGCF